MRSFLLVLVLLIIPVLAYSATIMDHDFEDGTNGALSGDTNWAIQATGGVGDSKAYRLTYDVKGTAGNQASLSVASYETNTFWVELDVKITGTMNGGMKFIKFFGESAGSQNNLTLGNNYSSNTQVGIAYYGDTTCSTRLSGQWFYYYNCPDTTYPVTTASIDLRGGTYVHYKAYVKRADPGVKNGEVKIWFKGVLVAHQQNMDSNPGSIDLNGIHRINFGDYTDSNNSTWYFWIDNLYVGTTEKDAAPDTTKPAVSSHVPADLATDITKDSTITVTYDETITCATPTVVLSQPSLAGTPTCVGSVVTIPVSNQEDGSSYNFSINGIKDIAAVPNEQTVEHTFSYTTAAAPGTGDSVLGAGGTSTLQTVTGSSSMVIQ